MPGRGLQHPRKWLCREAAHSSEVCTRTQVVLGFGCRTVGSLYLSSGNCNRLLYQIAVLFSGSFKILCWCFSLVLVFSIIFASHNVSFLASSERFTHRGNKCFLPGWSSFSSRCRCEVINTKLKPSARRGELDGMLDTPTLLSEESVAQCPQNKEYCHTLHSLTKNCVWRCSHRPFPVPGWGRLVEFPTSALPLTSSRSMSIMGGGLLKTHHCFWLWNTWRCTRNESFQASAAKPTFSILSFCCVMKSLVWQLWDWFSRAIRCSGLWPYRLSD